MDSDITDNKGNSIISHLSLISSIFSFIGSLFIICMFILFSELRTFAFKIIFLLSFSDLLISLSSFLITETKNINNSNALCQIQSIVSNFAGLSSIFWTNVIAYIVYQTVTNPNSYKKPLRFYLIFTVGIPLFMTMMYLLYFFFFLN